MIVHDLYKYATVADHYLLINVRVFSNSLYQSPLLPGLPDDLGIACLIRVPGFEHRKLRLVCKTCGCHLYLFGGKDPLKKDMRRVVFYSARTNKWHRAPDMLRRRHFSGSCVINNCLYVAGGENEGVHRSLRSAEVFDPNKNRWSYISDMSTAMVPFIGVVNEGKWFLQGIGSHQQVMSEVYQPEPIAGTMSITKHIDSRKHLGNSRALEVAALVPLNGKPASFGTI
ncbi:F-box/kelch-repeat protein [Hibiscus syriacus]|uniref:F-box/kelch-repeat protein n=1 Tax=Hibiscus syriacus TaxID=106335 RepID=A0A6A2WRU4_HIBSY|nr:F-box/kelch-repeat protein [Hibiscus syriacus]